MAMIQLDPDVPMYCKAVEGNSKASDFLEFLEELCEDGQLLPGDVLVVDNASIHKAAYIVEDMQNLCATYGFSIRFLPTYSPELNPIENIFGILKEHLRLTLDDSTHIGIGFVHAVAEKVDVLTVLKCYLHSIFGSLYGTAV
jgi:hypothetical protein